jgi:hypothetical protein
MESIMSRLLYILTVNGYTLLDKNVNELSSIHSKFNGNHKLNWDTLQSDNTDIKPKGRAADNRQATELRNSECQ